MIPDDFDLQLATLFGCALTTGFGVITNNADLKIGEPIAVFGAGGVGLNQIQAAALTSAYPIIAVDIFENKLSMAARFGASHLIHSENTDVEREILKIVGSVGVDIAIDNTGNTEVIALAYKLTKPQGRTILVGVPQDGRNISIHSLPLHFGKILTGSHGGECNPTLDIPKYINLHLAGKLKLDGLITNIYPLSEINVAIKKMRIGEIEGRCLISM